MSRDGQEDWGGSGRKGQIQGEVTGEARGPTARCRLSGPRGREGNRRKGGREELTVAFLNFLSDSNIWCLSRTLRERVQEFSPPGIWRWEDGGTLGWKVREPQSLFSFCFHGKCSWICCETGIHLC